jgi:hypothetical protein
LCDRRKITRNGYHQNASSNSQDFLNHIFSPMRIKIFME